MLIKQRHLRTISRRFWGLLFGSIIAFAVLVQIGRQAFPLVNDYKHIIAKSMGDQLGVVVDIGEISAEWRGLRPKVILNQVVVQSDLSQEIFYVDTALAELSLLDSFIQGGPAWRTITFERFRTTLVQGADFSWSLKGYDGGTANADNPFLFDDPLDIFLFGRRVQIDSASINFEFYNGQRTELKIPLINLENDRFFHRMTASLNIEDKESLNLVLEGYGDPRNKDKFSASGYIGLKDIATTDIFNTLFNKNEQGGDQNTSDELTNIEFWFKGSPKAGMTGTGTVSVSGLPSTLETHIDLPDAIKTNITGAWKDGAGWFLNIQDIDVTWAEKKLPIDAVSFSGKANDIRARVAELDITSLVDVVLSANKDRDSAVIDAISALNPQGQVSDVEVSFRPKDQGYFLARMNVENGSVEPFKGSPAVRNLSGYVETSLDQGYIDSRIENDFILDLAKVFAEPITIDDVVGQVAWRVDFENKTAYVKSSPVRATHKDSNVKGAFALTLPFVREVGEQRMTLQLEVDDAGLDELKSFIPKTIPKQLASWLDTSLSGGRAKDIEIFFDGSVSKKPESQPIYQLSGSVSDLDVRYDKRWPLISDVTSDVFIDSGAVYATVSSGLTKGARITKARLRLGKTTNGVTPPINIEADIKGKTKDAQSFLMATPVVERFSGFLSEWDFDGQFTSALSLSIPVKFNEADINYRVETVLTDNNAKMSRVGLEFEELSGTFLYSKKGLAESSGLSVSLWGQEIDAQILSDGSSGDIEIGFESMINVGALKSWLNMPELFALNSDFNADGAIRIPTSSDSDLKAPEINLRSTLKGVELNLPAPLGKLADDEGLYALDIRFAEDGVSYQYQHDLQAFADIYLADGALPAIALSLGGSRPEVLKFPGQIVVAGELPTADFDEWLTAYRDYAAESARLAKVDSENSGSDESDGQMKTTANLAIGTFSFGEFLFPELAVEIKSEDTAWVFNLDAERAKGLVTLPAGEAPLELMFDRLVLQTDKIEEETELSALAEVDAADADAAEADKVSVLADVDLSEFVAMDVSIEKLDILDDDWGRWQFALKPIENGIVLNDLQADFKQLRVGLEVPSEFYWTKSEGQSLSRFNGQIAVSNVAEALEAWELDPIVTSKNGVFDIRAHWLAEPDLVALQNLIGDVNVSLNDGSFVRATAAGENPLLRLIALFNFDTLARRLRLDFSDLAARGFAYDSVRSKINFASGIAMLSEPVVVKSSSSRMQMAGIVDLVNEEVDAQLVATLPVASNLAVATAFLVGVPAGIGVYIVSKMLGKTVDKASSINYSVTGSWDDPKIKVRKIFDDTAALRKGEELKEEQARQAIDAEKAKQDQSREAVEEN